MTDLLIAREKNENIFTKKHNILEEYDYQEKVRLLTFHKRVKWFVENKHMMGINEKWDAFEHIVDDYPGYDRARVLDLVNNAIRSNMLKLAGK